MTDTLDNSFRRSATWAASFFASAVLAGGCQPQNGGKAENGQEQAWQAGTGTNQGETGRQQNGGTADIALGTFSPEARQGTEGAQGRLPGPGDDAIYVPNTDLFPGSARLDPAIKNPYEGSPEAVAAGERHFTAFNCAGCHAPLGGGGMGPPLSDDAWIHGSEPAQIYLSIMHGRAEGMPAWSSMLPRQTVWELVAYVQSLSEIDDYAAERGFDSARSRPPNQQQGEPGQSGGDTTQ